MRLLFFPLNQCKPSDQELWKLGNDQVIKRDFRQSKNLILVVNVIRLHIKLKRRWGGSVHMHASIRLAFDCILMCVYWRC